VSNVRITIDRKAATELMCSPEVLADLRRRAEAIADRAGPGHIVEAEAGRKRARAVVITEWQSAKRNEATRRTLTRAIDAGRG